jgi:hypothetical protein
VIPNLPVGYANLWEKSGIPNISLHSSGGNELHNLMSWTEGKGLFLCNLNASQYYTNRPDGSLSACGIGKDNNGTMLSAN